MITPIFVLLSLRFLAYLTIFIPLASLAFQSLFNPIRLIIFSLYLHMFSVTVQCPCVVPLPSLFLSFSLIVLRAYTVHTQTRSHVLSISTRLGNALVPRQTGWSHGEEGQIEEVHMLGLQWREIIADIKNTCCCVSVLSSRAFMCFYSSYFISCLDSAIHLWCIRWHPSLGNCPVCRMHIYSLWCCAHVLFFWTCVEYAIKESAPYFLVWLWAFRGMEVGGRKSDWDWWGRRFANR